MKISEVECASGINTNITNVSINEISSGSVGLMSSLYRVSNISEDFNNNTYKPLSLFYYPPLLVTRIGLNTVPMAVRNSISTAVENNIGLKLDRTIFNNLNRDVAHFINSVSSEKNAYIFWLAVMQARRLINEVENERGFRDIFNGIELGFLPFLVTSYSPPQKNVKSLTELCSTVIAKSLDEIGESDFEDQRSLSFYLLHDNISRYTLNRIIHNPALRMDTHENLNPVHLPTCSKDMIKISSEMEFKSWETGVYDSVLEYNPATIRAFIRLEYDRHKLINSFAQIIGLKKVLTN